jgi:hypothetical protein
MKMGFTPITFPSVQEDEDQFRHHGKLIKMGFTFIALPSARSIVRQKKAKDEDQVIHLGKPMKMGFTPIALPLV